MRAILLLFIISLFFEVSLKAQLHIPDAKNNAPGLVNYKHINPFKSENQPDESTVKQWHILASPTSEAVAQTSIACDGSEMINFYREPDKSINIDKGVLKKWDGSHGADFAGATNQCHSPDVDIDGNVVVATWYTDAYGYGYGSNINGPWVSFSGTFLQHQYYPRAVI